MGYQVYFYQSEEDVDDFLDFMGSINVFFLHKGRCVHADEMYTDMIEQMRSYLRRFILIPGGPDGIEGELTGAFTGVEFLICCKGSASSSTYDIGRLYYRNDESNPYNAQMIRLYKKLKAYMRKNYIYYKETSVYCGPDFHEGYVNKSYFASQAAGRPLELR